MPPAKGSRSTGGAASNKISQSDASRIQSTQAKAGADTGKGAFPARAQAAAARNANAGATSPAGGKAGKGGKGSS